MGRPEKDQTYVSKKQMAESIIVLLGGRVAEKIILDDISTGASNDLERATSTARKMVTRYGFSDNLGPVVYGHDDSQVFLGRDYNSTPSYSDAVASEIDHEIRNIIENSFEACESILREHIDKLHELAQYLIENEKIDGETFDLLMKGELNKPKTEEKEYDIPLVENKDEKISSVIQDTIEIDKVSDDEQLETSDDETDE